MLMTKVLCSVTIICFELQKDTVTIIWSFGETDNIEYHAMRGGSSVNLLDPLPPPIDFEDDR